MEIILNCLKAFLVGGAICLVGQILIDYTKLTPARILVSFVVSGVFLSAVGLYKPLVEFAGAGATVPLTGFGHMLAEGARKGVEEFGFLGALCGGMSAAATGISAAIFFGFIMSLIFKPGDRTK
jgi:stage V sporulation protein AE